MIEWNCPCGTSYKFHGFKEPKFDYKEHAEGLQRDYDLLLAEYNALKNQPHCKPLTDEQREDVLDEMINTHGFTGDDCGLMVDYVINAVEALHNIKEKA